MVQRVIPTPIPEHDVTRAMVRPRHARLVVVVDADPDNPALASMMKMILKRAKRTYGLQALAVTVEEAGDDGKASQGASASQASAPMYRLRPSVQNLATPEKGKL